MPRPMPWPAPVTSATLPASRPIEAPGLVEPAVQRARAPLVRDDGVLDRLPDARWMCGAVHTRCMSSSALSPCSCSAYGVHLEILHPRRCSTCRGPRRASSRSRSCLRRARARSRKRRDPPRTSGARSRAHGEAPSRRSRASADMRVARRRGCRAHGCTRPS
jgi:hypothetical protein